MEFLPDQNSHVSFIVHEYRLECPVQHIVSSASGTVIRVINETEKTTKFYTTLGNECYARDEVTELQRSYSPDALLRFFFKGWGKYSLRNT